MIAKHVFLAGQVQGLGFRDWLVGRARELGLVGWVRNRCDGRVEALIAGEAAVVEELLRACRCGPPGAYVREVSEDLAQVPSEPGFVRRPTV